VAKSCLKDYVVIRELGRGNWGTVFEVKSAEGQIRVLKMLILNAFIPSRNCDLWRPNPNKCKTTSTEYYLNEVQMTNIMGDNGIGPRYYGSWTCKADQISPPRQVELAFILSEKFGPSFEDWVNDHKDLWKDPGVNALVRGMIEDKVKQVEKLGFHLYDLHEGNILFDVNEHFIPIDIRMIDFESARVVPESHDPLLEKMYKRIAVTAIYGKPDD